MHKSKKPCIKKNRHLVFVLVTIFLFSSSLSGYKAEASVKKILQILDDAPSAFKNFRGFFKSLSELGMAMKFGINLREAKAAQLKYPKIDKQAKQIYIEMMRTSGAQSLAKAQDAVQQAADKQNMVITVGTVSTLAGGVVVYYGVNHQSE